MGRITTGVGLISGLNISELVDNLLAIEGRPINLLAQRISTANAQRTALEDLSAKLLALQLTNSSLASSSIYNSRTATSSNPAALSATATTLAALGTYQVRPIRLSQPQQFISSGLATREATPVGAGTITVKLGGYVSTGTPLDSLNGGLGVNRGKLTITDRSGASAVIDLTAAVSVTDVLTAINSASTIRVEASVQGDAIVIADKTGATASNLTVQEVGSGTTAAGLGLLGSIAGNTLVGADIVKLSPSLRLGFLNDANGVRKAPGVADFRITLRDGTTLDVDLGAATTLGGVLAAINDHVANGGKLTAAVAAGSDRLLLTDNTAGGGALAVTALNQSQAAGDLGILGTAQVAGVLTGRRTLAELQSILLRNVNGGAGIASPGQVQLTSRSGASATIDLTLAESLSEVVAAINATGIGLVAAANTAADGILITDTTGASASNLIVADVGGSTAAADLKIAVNAAVTSKNSGDLNLRYLSENTRLDQLNAGAGIVRGRFRIQNTAGATADIDLTSTTYQTLGDVLVAINTAAIGVTATINTTGDGILLTDTAGGAGQLIVSELGGGTAGSLRLAGAGTTQIDGAFRYTAVLDADDTLDDALTKLTASGAPVLASVIHDGSLFQPYRLLITSSRPGNAGRVLIDTGTTGLSLATLSAASDAVLELGGIGSAGTLVTSSSNTFNSIFPGLSFTALNTSPSNVSVTVNQDSEALEAAVKQLVDNFNKVISTVTSVTRFDPTTEVRGVLQGDLTAQRIRESLLSLAGSEAGNTGNAIRNLGQLGITIKGDSLVLDETVLATRLAADPAAVKDFLSASEVGLAPRLKRLVENLTLAGDGVISRRVTTLDDLSTDLEDRATFLSDRLAARREILLGQFLAMERALAEIQSQGNALSQLANLAQFASTNRTNR